MKKIKGTDILVLIISGGISVLAGVTFVISLVSKVFKKDKKS